METETKRAHRGLYSLFIPYYNNYYRAVEFVDKNMECRKHNKNSRYLRAYRKCTLNRFNYFVLRMMMLIAING